MLLTTKLKKARKKYITKYVTYPGEGCGPSNNLLHLWW